MNIVSIRKKDKENNLPRESTSSIRIGKKNKSISERKKNNRSEESGNKGSSSISINKKELAQDRKTQENITEERKDSKNKDLKEDVPRNFFYKIYKTFHCKDIEFIKKLYEEFKSYPEIERFFRGRNTEIIPNQQVIKRIVRDSFESKKKYKIWKSNIYLKELQEIAGKKDGKCISEEYENSKTPLDFKCKKGHIFKMRPNDIKTGSWCPECFINERKLGLEVFQEIAREKDGKCISEEYENNKAPLNFECKNGHIFKMRPDVVKEGSWCPECFINERKLGLEVFQEIAGEKDGKCISEEYENSKTPLEFECKHGHIFKMRPDHVKIGYWCPECREYICHYGAPPEVRFKNIQIPKGLKQHLELIKKTKDFPKEVKNEVLNTTNGLINMSRISEFQITKISFNERVDFEQELINKGFIKFYNLNYLLCSLSNPKNFNNIDILGHGGGSHKAVLHHIINNDKNSVGIEIPIWLRNNSNMITGHIDLIRIDNDGTPYVIDYKPEKFFHALPQVCIYGIVLKKMCNLEKLKCAIFNKDIMWEFNPELMLKKVNKLLNSKSIDCCWNDYI